MELGGEPALRFNGDFKTEFKAKNDGKEEARLPVKQRRDLDGNFIDVIRGGGPLTATPSSAARRWSPSKWPSNPTDRRRRWFGMRRKSS